jgi:hypothetical protein
LNALCDHYSTRVTHYSTEREPRLARNEKFTALLRARKEVYEGGSGALSGTLTPARCSMIFSPASSHISIRWVKRVRVFMPGRPATVMVWPRCWRALGLRQGGGRYGGTTMAKILNEALLFKLSRTFGLILWHWLIAIAGRSCESSKALRQHSSETRCRACRRSIGGDATKWLIEARRPSALRGDRRTTGRQPSPRYQLGVVESM